MTGSRPREEPTPFAREVIAYYEAGFSYKQIAKLVNRHPSTVGEVMRRLRPDLIRHERKGITYQLMPNIEFERAQVLYEKGLSVAEVAKALNIARSSVSYRLDRAGVPRRPRTRRPSGLQGSQNGNGPELSARV